MMCEGGLRDYARHVFTCFHFTIRELKEMDGVKVDGHNTANITYADDIVLVADSQEDV